MRVSEQNAHRSSGPRLGRTGKQPEHPNHAGRLASGRVGRPRGGRGVALTLAVVALLAAACGSSTPKAASQPTATSAATLKTSSTSAGTVLATANGYTVYVLLSASGATLSCTGACAAIWPPVTLTGTPTAGSGVTAHLSTSSTTSGLRLLVDGRPVYHFRGDTAPGQAKGQDLHTFGGIWHALTPAGTPLSTTSPAPSPSTTPSSSSGGYGYGY